MLVPHPNNTNWTYQWNMKNMGLCLKIIQNYKNLHTKRTFKPILEWILPQITSQRIQHSKAETHGLFSTHLLFHLVDVVARAVVVDQAVAGGGVGCLVTRSMANSVPPAITHLVSALCQKFWTKKVPRKKCFYLNFQQHSLIS